jgi:arabinonate dehydratase
MIGIKPGLQIYPDDNVYIVLQDVRAGENITAGHERLEAKENVAGGHKLAARKIEQGTAIVKGGQIIAVATTDIETGHWVHLHNSEMPPLHVIKKWLPAYHPEILTADKEAIFLGYKRPVGRAGTRNNILVISTANCSAMVTKQIARSIRHKWKECKPATVDSIVAVTHATGCGIGTNEDLEILRRTMRGYLTHPNVAGALVVGLGCEMNDLQYLGVKQPDKYNIRSLSIQECGGAHKSIQKGVKTVGELIEVARCHRRSACPVSDLLLALQCGGSDGFSGITANPSLGHASDLLVAAGGGSILSETPEIYGAENLLIGRAASPDIANKLNMYIAWWEDHVANRGGTLNQNPSPGNHEGGLTTIIEKSLGAVTKGGHSPLQGAIDYADADCGNGLQFMDSPGYDPCSITGQIAAGANMICFTTGRGSIYGSRMVPCLKLASNSLIYNSMNEDMDINCGAMVDDGLSINDMGGVIFKRIIEVASGIKTKNEESDYCEEAFVPWMKGFII